MTDHDAAFGQLACKARSVKSGATLMRANSYSRWPANTARRLPPISLVAGLPIACSRRDHFTRLETLARNSAAVVRQVAPA